MQQQQQQPIRNSPITKSPRPFINKKPENEQNLQNPKVVPGIRPYAKAASPPKPGSIALIGDSNFHGIRELEMQRCINISNAKVTKKSYSGATAEHLFHYVDIALLDRPETNLIHDGTNDIYGRNSQNKAAAEIALDIINIGVKSREFGTKNILISSVITINDIQSNEKVKHVNTLLKSYCEHYNFGYICNDFLTTQDLKFGDPVHLSFEGRCKLVKNYIDFLENYWLPSYYNINGIDNLFSPLHTQFTKNKNTNSSNENNDIDALNSSRAKHLQNPFFAYYNINSLRYKFDDLK